VHRNKKLFKVFIRKQYENEILSGKGCHGLAAACPPEIAGQAAPSGLTFHLPLFLFGHPHLNGC